MVRGRDFLLSTSSADVKAAASRFELIVDTVSAEHDLNQLLGMVKRDGTLVLVGVPPEGIALHPFSLIPRRRRLAGSMIGGIAETQEMLDFCADKGIVADIEMVAARDIETAYERMQRSDVKYRFVIDNATLAG